MLIIDSKTDILTNMVNGIIVQSPPIIVQNISD